MGNDLDVNKNSNSKKLVAWIVAIVIIIGIVVGAVLCWNRFLNNTPTLSPDFAPKQEEKYAESMGDENDAKLPQSEGGGAVSLTYSTDVTINLKDQKAYLYFGNPTKSNQDMLLQIVVHDTVMAQSNTLVPGKQINKIDLIKDAASKLEPGGYNGKFVILYYQKDTGEKAAINTDIPVKITVK